MKIIFFGSDDFAQTSLERLLDNKCDVVACVTHPDRAKGRGMKIAASPIKVAAGKAGISVLQPENIRTESFVGQLKSFEPELFVVIAYGKILSEEVLNIPTLCSVNVHASLLPKYRGAAPINWAILNGEEKTGVSVIRLNTKMDAGEVIEQEEVDIAQDDTSISLRKILADLGAGCLIESIDLLEKGTASFSVQDDRAVTFAPKLTKQLGKIDWTKSAQEIHNQARGLLPWPGAYTKYKGKLLKILEAEAGSSLSCGAQGSPGDVCGIGKNDFSVMTGSGCVNILRVHLADANPMDAASFVQGHKLELGMKLG